MIIGTAGHIDHGKTALVKALTGVDTDRLPEEKRRGITVELGFAPIDLPGAEPASIIDVPGHEAFVKTMIAGAAGIDVALLVIAADEGAMPQTREHLEILALLGIPRLVVALTKADLVETEWLELVRAEIQSSLAGTPWPSAPIVPCSAVTGQGIPELRAGLADAAANAVARSSGDLFRLPVDRAFTLKGIGTVVTGSVWSGNLSTDAEVIVLPAGNRFRVRRLHRHGAEVPEIAAGDRAAVALAGVEVAEVPRGCVLVTEPSWSPTDVIDARVRLLPGAHAKLAARTELRLQLGGADVAATLSSLGAIRGPDALSFARLRLSEPIAARGGDRFILRLPAPVGTIGGGVVLDPYPARRTLSSSAKLFGSARAGAALGATDEKDGVLVILEALLAAADAYGLPARNLSVRLGRSAGEVATLLAKAGAVLYDGHAFTQNAVDRAKEALLDGLRRAEKTFPLADGVKKEAVMAEVGGSAAIAALALELLSAEGAVETEGAFVRRSGWSPALSESDARKAEALVHAICSSGSQPPSLDDLAERYGGDVSGLLRYLERKGRLVQVEPDRFYDREAAEALIEKLRGGMLPGEQYAASQLREMLGFSRKYLIPFLEYCDRTGVTQRSGDVRTLRGGRSA